MRKKGTNGKDNMGDRATRLLHPNMAENATHTKGGRGLDRGVHTTDTEQMAGQQYSSFEHILSNNSLHTTWEHEEVTAG